MPFAVFRQHQRKLLAVFAILAMIGFVLSDTLPRWMNSGGVNAQDSEVANLYGKKIHRSDLNAMRVKRQHANQFMSWADRFSNPNFFGGMTSAEIIDALILEHEADRLGIPATAAFGRDWIDQQTKNSGMAMNAGLFETILARFDNKISGEQVLIDVASQARLLIARSEIAMPIVTPLDVFRSYRDQTERTSFKVVPYLAESYTAQVGEPTETEIADLFAKYKDVLPDAASPTPGFKIPRKVNVEFLWVDIDQLVKKARASVVESELKDYYSAHKTEYPIDIDLPADLFSGAPELTPPRYTPFELVRDSIAETIAREKANVELQDTFNKIRTDEIDKFADDYHNVEDEISDAKKEGQPTDKYILPTLKDLSSIAAQYGLKHETTGLIDRREAETAHMISLARSGSSSTSPRDTKSFAEVAFNPKTLLYESFEMSDLFGNRYVGRKIDDKPAHVAELKEVRDQVVRAWKLDKARPLARKAADEYAIKLRGLGGVIKELSVDNHLVLSIDSVTKLQPGMPNPSPYPGFPPSRGPAVPSEIRQIPMPGSFILDKLFALKPGEVEVEADLPQSTYYVMALEKRQPVSFQSLLGPNGAFASYSRETEREMMRKTYRDGMERLRDQAGYKPGDYPTDGKSQDEDQG